MDNKYFQQIQHNSVEPVTVVRDGDDALIIQGVKFTGDFFRAFADEAQKREVKPPMIRTLHDAVSFFLNGIETLMTEK